MSDYNVTSGDTPTVTFTFSEPPSGFDLGDVTQGNGSMSAFAGGGTVYTATFTPTPGIEDPTNVVTAGTDWSDGPGNPPVASTNSPNYTVDTIP